MSIPKFRPNVLTAKDSSFSRNHNQNFHSPSAGSGMWGSLLSLVKDSTRRYALRLELHCRMWTSYKLFVQAHIENYSCSGAHSELDQIEPCYKVVVVAVQNILIDWSGLLMHFLWQKLNLHIGPCYRCLASGVVETVVNQIHWDLLSILDER